MFKMMLKYSATLGFMVIVAVILSLSFVTGSAFAAKILFQVSGKAQFSFTDTLALCGDKEPELYTVSVNIRQFRTDRMG